MDAIKKISTVPLNNQKKILDKIKAQKPMIIRTNMNLTKPLNQFLIHSGLEPIKILKNVSKSGTRKECLVQTVTIDEYLNGKYINSGWYLASNFIKNRIFKQYESNLLNSNQDLFELINLRKAVMVNLWLSPSNKFTGLHYDSFDNFNLQITGSKKFFIAPPQIKNFYTGKILEQKDHTSNVQDIFTYDTNRFPKFSQNLHKFRQAELNSGDILYLPSFWWHQVQTGNSALSININWWYINYKAMIRHPKKTLGIICLQTYRKLFQKHLA